MKNKNWNTENIVKKWKPVVQSLEFDDKYIPKICEYAEMHTITEANSDYFQSIESVIPTLEVSLLSISLDILKRVKDLSKIHFIKGVFFNLQRNNEIHSETVKTHSFSISINREDMMHLRNQTEVNIIKHAEDKLIDGVAEMYNKLIEEGNDLYIYLVGQSLRIISESTMDSTQIMILSRFHSEKHDIILEEKPTTSITIDDL